MSKISQRKRPIPWLETDALVRDGSARPLLVRLDGSYLHMRAKGRRKGLSIPLLAAWERAGYMAMIARKLEKKAKCAK